jgi:hypothetical protein
MADPRDDLDPADGGEVHDLEIRKITDDEFGLVVTLNEDPGPDERKGFWIQLDRESLEELVQDATEALRRDPPQRPN